MKLRYRELDSLRGVAAVAVVFLHYLSISKYYSDICDPSSRLDGPLCFIKYSPIHFLFSGNESVTFFFVLSGFVLFSSMKNGVSQTYAQYIVRRIFRIYVPFIIVATFALLANYLFSFDKILTLSNYFNEQWGRSPTIKDIVMTYSFLFGFDQTVSISPAWSLVAELHYSIVFPLIYFVVIMLPARVLLPSALLLSFVGSAFYKLSDGNIFCLSLTFVFEFIVGASLANGIEDLKSRYASLSRARRFLFFSICFLSYTYNWWFFPSVKNLHWVAIQNFFVTIGAVGFIVAALSERAARTVLGHRIFVFMGNISYSLYLCHICIVIVLAHYLYLVFPYEVIGVMSVFVSLFVSYLLWKFVEIPSIKFGRSLAERMAKFRPA